MSLKPQNRAQPPLKAFVDSFNKRDEFKGTPIVAFQFVSLDDIHDGKMVWWNYIHSKVNDSYLKVIEEFTGKDNGDIKNTLINWEWDEDIIWYQSLGSSCILKKFTPSFLPVTFFEDDSGIQKLPANPAEKKKLAESWKDAQCSAFAAGAALWISLPHKENKGDNIFSSIFCLFNNPLGDEKLLIEVYKRIRNFILDYLIDLYRKPFKLEISALMEAIDIEDYRPINFSYTGKTINSKIKTLFDKYISDSYKSNFAKKYQDAKNRIEKTYKSETKSFDNVGLIFPSKYKVVSNITPSNSTGFFNFIYGRLIILSYHIIFKISLKDAYSTLRNKEEKYKLTIGDFQKMFGIKGLRNDSVGTSQQFEPNINLEVIIKNISEAEFNFLLSICNYYIADSSISSTLSDIKSIRQNN